MLTRAWANTAAILNGMLYAAWMKKTLKGIDKGLAILWSQGVYSSSSGPSPACGPIAAELVTPPWPIERSPHANAQSPVWAGNP